MKRLAVDFVLLPPAPLMNEVISLNNRLCNSNIILDRDKCFPHISLFMGCLTHDALVSAKFVLRTIASQTKVMQLKIPGARTVGTEVGNVLALDIEPNKVLQSLHESIVHSLGDSLSTDAAKADVFGSSANDSTLGWINGFAKESSFDNFWPHITVGYLNEGAKPENIEPHSFTASRLAICHLGNYCTCREILEEAQLVG